MLCANMKNKYIAQTKNLARSTFCGIAKAVRVCILLSMVVRIIRSRGENMGSPTSEYNQKLRERLLLIKEKARLSNEQIAEFMDCDARHVSRILNGEAKATPAIVRPRKLGGYEIISGHRRAKAADMAGLFTLPCIVRNLDDDAATILMVDANLQRENILPSERAWAFRMKYDAMKRQGERSDLTSGQIGPKLRTDEVMASEANESARNIKRYIRLTYLLPNLLDMVDEKKLGFNIAVELSFLTPEKQNDVLNAMDYA